MLAPAQSDVEDDLVEISNVIRDIGRFAQSCLSASVAQQSPALLWITDAQAILAACRGAAQQWLAAKPDCIPLLINMFASYSSLMSAGVTTLTPDRSADDWTKFLVALKEAAKGNAKSANAAMLVIAGQQTDFLKAHDDLQQAVQEAQAAAEAENVDIQAVGVQIQGLMDRVNSLSDGATAEILGAGESMGQTAVSITYDAITAVGEVEVPYFAMVAIVYTSGSSIYQLVENDSQIGNFLDQIATLMVQLDHDIRILAMTKALLATLARMNDAYLFAAQVAPRLNAYWNAEVDKIDIVVEAIANGVAPAHMTELASMTKAEAVWTRLAQVAAGLGTPETPVSQTVPLKISVPAN